MGDDDDDDDDDTVAFLHFLGRERIVLTAIWPDKGAGKGTRSKQFTNAGDAADWAAKMNAEGWNLYYTVNPARDVTDKLVSGGRPSGDDIKQVFAFKMDLDRADRLKKADGNEVSATDAEKGAISEVLKPLIVFLTTNIGGSPTVVDSGNGYNVLIRLDPMPEPTKDFQQTCKAFMDFLVAKFDASGVKLDTTVTDLPRVLALPGTVKRKGEPTEERPHRVVEMLSWGEPVKTERFAALASKITGWWNDKAVRRLALAAPRFDQFHNEKLAFVGGLVKNPAGLAPDKVIPTVHLVTWLQCEPNWNMDAEESDNEDIVERAFAMEPGDLSMQAIPEEGRKRIHKALDEGILEDGAYGKMMEKYGGGTETVPHVLVLDKDNEPITFNAKFKLDWVRTVNAQKDYEQAILANIQTFNHTDTGNGKRLSARFGRFIRYIKTWDRWVVWDGVRWRVDEGGVIMDQLGKISAQMILTETIGNSKIDAHTIAWAKSSENGPKIREAIKMARSEPGIPISHDGLDGTHTDLLLNTLTGVINLRTGELGPHDPDLLITMLSPVEFRPDAEAPRFKKFIERILPDEGTRKYVQRFLGYSLTGETKEKKFVINYNDEGDTGRTTLAETFLNILGDYGAVAEFTTFLEQKGDKIRNDLARLKGRRFVVASETTEQRVLDDGLMKQLTGRDTVTARFLHKEYFSYKPKFKIWLMANVKPIIKSKGQSMWNRVRLIFYPESIPKDEQELDLPDKLVRDASGILNWLLEGCKEWAAGGLIDGGTVTEKTDEYRREMDSVLDFIETYCDRNEKASITFSDFNSTYTAWCRATGRFKENETVVGRRLGAMFEKNRAGENNVTTYRGLHLKDGVTSKIFATGKTLVISLDG